MNPNPHSPMVSDSNAGEETLRLIARLPAPAGLEERVHSALHAAPRMGRVLAWPPQVGQDNNWVRAVAAAAIVFVVVGGGWGVYSRVPQGQPGKVLVMPQAPASGGFGGAGAIRTPQTLQGPTVSEPGTKGPMEQGTEPAKKASGPKKDGSAKPAAGQPVPQVTALQ
jgi:hypothetical protein